MTKAAYLITGALVAVMGTAGVVSAHGGTGGKGRGMDASMLFERFDSNEDGQITQSEVDAVLAAQFAEADAAGNGALSAEDMAAFIAARAAERNSERGEKRREARIARMIDRLDADEDGAISLEELAARGPARMFERLDANEDGAITEEEVQNARGGKHRDGRKQD